MKRSDFCQLHNHSYYSKFDGFMDVKALVKAAKQHGHKYVGLTDHGTVAGAIAFIKACREMDIKPILGMETYLCRSMSGKNSTIQPDRKRGNKHLNLFAKNMTGYKNLCTLSQMACIEGYYYQPRIDIETLAKYSSGIICSSACLSSVVNWNLRIDRYDHAKKAATILKDIFKDDFYMEIMYHGLESEAKVLPGIQKLSKELDIKTCVTNDAHYRKKSDAKYHEAVMAISSRKCIKDPKRINFPYDEFYLKSTEEMLAVFPGLTRSMKNTVDLASKCDLSDLQFGGMKLPEFRIPGEFTSSFEYVEHLAWEGFRNKGFTGKKEYEDRLKLELSDVKLVYQTKNYDFSTYFLMVEDIVRFCRENDIPSDVRGSGNGSLLLYCLGITNIDSVRFELLWPRFLGFDFLCFHSKSDFGIIRKGTSNATHALQRSIH